MQVPQWVVQIPIGRRDELGPRAMSLWSGRNTDYFLLPEFLS